MQVFENNVIKYAQQNLIKSRGTKYSKFHQYMGKHRKVKMTASDILSWNLLKFIIPGSYFACWFEL